MTEDAFGFSAAQRKTAEKIKGITPTSDPHLPAEIERVDAAGAALGFIPRETSRVVVPRRRKEIGPTVAINMRVPERVAAKFVTFCDQQRMSYWEGVEELMRRSEVG